MPETPAVEPAASEPLLSPPTLPMPAGTPQADDDAVRRWPAIMALLVGWLMPRSAARQLAHVGLPGALAVQVASGISAVLAFLFMISWTESMSLTRIFKDIASEISRKPHEFIMILAITVAIIESCLFGLALVLLPWGARDEKLRSSLYNAVRCVWLQTPRIAVGWIVAMLFVFALQSHRRNMNWVANSWFLRHADELGLYMMMLACIWCIWGMLQAVGARPARRRDDEAVLCQRCGYNLFGTPIDGRCSECGELVADSIAAESRPGSMWQRRADAGILTTWWRCGVQSIRNPRRLGRRLQVHRPVDDSWKLLVGHAVASGLTAVVTTFAWFGIMLLKGHVTISVADDAMWFSLPMAAFWTGMSVVTVASVAAGLVGLWFGWTQGCRVMPAAALVVSHLGGFLTLWVCYGCLAALLYTFTEDWHWGLRIGRWHYEVPLIVSTLSIVLNLAWIWIYARLVYIAVSETRYATR